jgi:CubicO group peptidase (beta-lactamase class C family)
MSDPRIQEALENAYRLGGEMSAEGTLEIAAYLNGEQVVNEVIGVSDPETREPATTSTLINPYSTVKIVTATALHMQAERGLVEYDEPIATYWPEFGANGKDKITVKQALCHRAGVTQLPPGVTFEKMVDWDWMIKGTEQLEPQFPPGEYNTYMMLIWGWIIGELVTRVDPQERAFDEFVQDEIMGPLGIKDFYLGVPDSELGRIAPVLWPQGEEPLDQELLEKSMPYNVRPGAGWNQKIVRQAMIPGGGGIMTADALANFLQVLAQRGTYKGIQFLSEERLLWCTVPREDPDGVDPILGWTGLVGQGGYWLGGERDNSYPIAGKGPHVLCQAGAGGSVAWVDMDSGLSVALLHNSFQSEEQQMTHDPNVNPFYTLADTIREVAYERTGVAG